MSEGSVQPTRFRKAVRGATLVVLFSILLATCTSDLIQIIDEHRGGNPRQRALIEYLAEVNRYGQLESKSIGRFNAVIGDDDVAAATTVATLRRSVLPGYRRVVTGVERIEPRSKDTARLHETLLSAMKKQLRGMEFTLAGFERQDPRMLDQGVELTESGRRQMVHYRSSLTTVASRLSVRLYDPDRGLR